jgi:hypothetical protein
MVIDFVFPSSLSMTVLYDALPDGNVHPPDTLSWMLDPQLPLTPDAVYVSVNDCPGLTVVGAALVIVSLPVITKILIFDCKYIPPIINNNIPIRIKYVEFFAMLI